MMSESEFGVRAVTSGGGGGNNNTGGTGRSRSGSSASASMRPLPPMPATMKATSLENESSDATSPTASTVSSSHSFTSLTNALQQQPQQQQQQQPFPGQSPLSPTSSTSSSNSPSPNSRLTPSQRSRSSPYVPSPLNPMGPMSTSPPSGSTPPVSWRASLTTPLSSISGSSSPAIIAPVPIKSTSAAPAPPPPGAALPRVSSSSAIANTGSANSRGSMSLQKFASEEEELLNSGVTMPLKPRSRPPSSSGNRPASMLLYRLASDDDRADPFTRPGSTMSLNPPNFRPGSISRFSTASQSPSVFSLSSDSKYPVFGSANPFDPPSAPFHQVGYDSSRSSSPGPSLHGQDRSSYYPGGAGTPPSPTTATQQGAFLPYEYDPAMDQDIVDDDDALHEPDPKGYKEGMGGVNGRGIANVLCLVILVLGLLSLFVVGPVIDYVQKDAFARAQNQPQIIAGPVGAANTADMLSSTASSSSVDDPFGLLTPTTTASRSSTNTRSSASTTATDADGNPIDPATVDDGTLTTTTRRGAAGAAQTTANDGTGLGRRADVRGRGEWAGLRLPRQTAR